MQLAGVYMYFQISTQSVMCFLDTFEAAVEFSIFYFGFCIARLIQNLSMSRTSDMTVLFLPHFGLIKTREM